MSASSSEGSPPAQPPSPAVTASARATTQDRATPLPEERLGDLVELRRHRLELGDRLAERHFDDGVAVQGGHDAPALRVDEVGGLQPVPGGQYAVARRRR